MSDSKLSTAAYTRRVAVAVALASLAIITGLFAWRLAGVWLLLFASVLFGVALRRVSTWLSGRTGMPLWTAVLLWMVLFTGLLAGFLWFVAASLVAQFADLTERIPRALESLREWASGYPFLQPVARDVEAFLGGTSGADGGASTGPDASTYLGRAVDASRVTLGTLANVLVMVVLAIYVALDGRRYTRGIAALAPPDWRDTVNELLETLGRTLPWWLAARLMSMTLVAVLISIGLTITGVPLPLMLGLIAGMFSFVPFLGPIASVVPAALVALTESGSALLSVLVVFGIVQLLESYLITPLIERRTVSVPLFPLIAAQLVGGALFGIPGVMFATPMLLTLTVAIQIVYQKRILGEDPKVWGTD